MGGHPPPRPSGGSGCGVAALIVGAVLVVVLTVAVAGGLFLLRTIDDAASSTTTAATRTTTGSSDESTETSSPETTAPGTTTGRPLPTGEASLGANPLFSSRVTGFAATRCDTQGVPEDPTRGATFFATELRCLDAGWRPIIEGAGFTFTSPDLKIITADRLTTACGSSDFTQVNVGAFYCSGDNTMYMLYTPQGVFRSVAPGSITGDYIAVFAHEYGHHIQNLIGTFRGFGRRVITSGGEETEAGKEARRRLELQGACFAGLATGGIYRGGGAFHQSDLPTLLNTQHSSENNLAWWRLGYEQNNVSLCNTWTAPASAVTDE